MDARDPTAAGTPNFVLYKGDRLTYLRADHTGHRHSLLLFFISCFWFRGWALGLYNNNVSCLRTVSGKNLLANPVILKSKLWEWV